MVWNQSPNHHPDQQNLHVHWRRAWHHESSILSLVFSKQLWKHSSIDILHILPNPELPTLPDRHIPQNRHKLASCDVQKSSHLYRIAGFWVHVHDSHFLGKELNTSILLLGMPITRLWALGWGGSCSTCCFYTWVVYHLGPSLCQQKVLSVGPWGVCGRAEDTARKS